MADKDASTPRVYLARHGETEWTINGRYTGNTELLLTPNGRNQVLSSGKLLLGAGKLIDPAKLAHVFISPRKRAQETFDLLFDGEEGAEAGDSKGKLAREGILSGKVTTTEALAEWDYGDYEGLVTKEIRELRAKRGLDKDGKWDIWRDGCEGGESAQQVTDRLDELIQRIHAIQWPCMHGEKAADVVLVSYRFGVSCQEKIVNARH